MASVLDSIRFSSKLSPVKVGQIIKVAGTVTENPKDFKILLGNEFDKSNDIQLALKFQFGKEPYVVRNSFSAAKGSWDIVSGEITEHLVSGTVQNPIKAGGNFEVTIETDTDKFLISINGHLFCTYKYRHPLSGLKRITVYGDAKNVDICDHHTREDGMGTEPGEFVGSIPVVKKGNCLVFHGQLKSQEGGEFSIELQDAQTGEEVLQVQCKTDTKKMSVQYQINGVAM